MKREVCVAPLSGFITFLLSQPATVLFQSIVLQIIIVIRQDKIFISFQDYS